MLLGRAGRNRNKTKQCQDCYHVDALVRESVIEQMWNLGFRYAEMREWTGIPTGTICSIVDRLRREGRADYRYDWARERAGAA